MCTCVCLRGTPGPAPIGGPRGVCSLQRYNCLFVPWSPLVPRPLEDREVPIFCSYGARFFVPGAPPSPRPLEDREVFVPSSPCARIFVPGAPPGPQPLEDREVLIFCSPFARKYVPGAPLSAASAWRKSPRGRRRRTPPRGGGRRRALRALRALGRAAGARGPQRARLQTL